MNSAEPTTRMSTPEASGELGRLAVDAAVDVDLAAVGLVAKDVRARPAASRCATSFMNDWPPNPGSTVMTMTMSMSSLYGSSADSGVPGLSGQPGGATGGPDRPQRRLDGLLDLDVDRDRVAAGVEVLLDVADRAR